MTTKWTALNLRQIASVFQPAFSVASAFVDFDAIQVVGENLLRYLGRLVAFLFVNGIKQVKNISEHVAGTACRYALHRIQSAEVLPDKSRLKQDFDLNDFAATQGHFGPAAPIQLKARICDQLAQILEESPISDRQSITPKDDSGYRIIEADVLETWQLRWWILGEAERIEILQPEALRQTILNNLKMAFEQY